MALRLRASRCVNHVLVLTSCHATYEYLLVYLDMSYLLRYCHQILRVTMASMAANAPHAPIPTLPQFARRALARLPPLVHARSCTYLGAVPAAACMSWRLVGWARVCLPLVDECWDELHTKVVPRIALRLIGGAQTDARVCHLQV